MKTFLLLLHLSAQLSRQPNWFKQKQKQTNFSKFLTTQSDTATRSSTWLRASSFGSEEVQTARSNRMRFSKTARRRYLHLRCWASPRSPSHRPRRLRWSLSPSPELLLLVLRVMFLCFYLHLHLRYSVSYVLFFFFFFFLGVMLHWDFLSRNDEHSILLKAVCIHRNRF